MSVPAPTDRGPTPDTRVLADDFESVMARCLERLDAGDESTVEALARAHPEHADRLRRRVQLLLDAGLLRGGRHFGPYRIVDTLGRGGMGVVYKALDERSQRLVALKALPSRLVDNPRSRARFEREVRAAASLAHPNIVPIIEWSGQADREVDSDAAGAGPTPWFAMEYVDGRTLAQVLEGLTATRVAASELDSTHLDQALAAEGAPDGAPDASPDGAGGAALRGKPYIEAVCSIVLDVAEALAHAHAHGVVHRDVKPSNILVRRDGRALLFDFGLARGEGDASLTLTGDFAGTPHYVSPEQVAPRGRKLDARTDIYSLGVTLYELLALRRPFEAGTLEEATRNILDREPPPLRRFNPAVPVELATICATAMEKDPARRYPDAAALVSDLRRWLGHLPIAAQPLGLAPRAWRWVSRRKAASLAGLLLAVLIVGTPLMLWRSNRLLRAEAHKTERMNDFLRGLIESPSPHRAGRDVTMREVLDVAVAGLGAEFGEDPATEGALRRTIGQTYLHLGQMDQAGQQFELAIARLEGLPAESARAELAEAFQGLGVVLSNQRREFERAEQLLQSALAVQRALPSPGVDEVADTLLSLSNHRLVTGDVQGGEESAREALALCLAPPGAEALTVTRAQTVLAALLWRQRQYDEAEALLLTALDTQAALLTPGHPRHVHTGIELGGLYSYRGEPERAAAVYAGLLPAAIQVMGDDHPDVARLRQLIARVVLQREDYAEADTLLSAVVPVYRATYPEGHDFLASALKNLGQARFHQGRGDEALVLMREALDMYRQVWGPQHPMAGEAAINLAWVLEQQGQVDASEALLLELLDTYAERFGAGHFMHSMVLERLADLNARAGRSAAEADYRARLSAAPPSPEHLEGH